MPSRTKGVQPIEWYPLRFREIYKKKIWGGPELSRLLKKKGCSAKTGESWEIAQLGRDVSVVSNGLLKGKSLTHLMRDYPEPFLGREHALRFQHRFPVMVKFLAAHDRLSLQVHPPDEFAQRYEPSGSGKMETWYVLHSGKEGRVIRGVLPGTTIAEFREHLSAGTVEQCLNIMEVERGDVIFIPPGTIHTAYGGVVLLEVQQTSDMTYRLTDWGRPSGNGERRPLEVEKAMTVTDFYSMGVSKLKPFRMTGFPYRRKLLIKCEKFTMESLELERRRIHERSDLDRFHILTVVQGNGKFYYGPKRRKPMPFRLGETFIIPAALGEYDISANAAAELVCSYVG